ncbi:hypothetical protein HRbin39_01091 [bacterium HR39]|nr:hypothetical protein HRbin39_01091 [bacterium HR39]
MAETGGGRPGYARMRLGVIMERRRIDHPWQKWRVAAVEVLPEPPELEPGRPMVEDEAVSRYYGGTFVLELFADETEAYKYNLSASRPAVYVILSEDPAARDGFRAMRVSASPWDAQAHGETALDRVDAVPMPEPVLAFVKDFVDRWYRDRPFHKRRRRGADRPPGEGSEFVPLGGGEEGS